MSTDKPRIIMVRQPLPDRDTPSERVRLLDADVREAMVLAEKRLRDYALKFSMTGWDTSGDSEYEYVGSEDGRNRRVIGKLRITRGGV